MPIEFGELRSELVGPSILGESLVTSTEDLIERRGGRILPSVEIAQIELAQLIKVSKKLSRTASLALDLLPVPQPGQLERITFDLQLGCWTLPTYQDPNNRTRYGRMLVRDIPNPGELAHRTMYQVFFGLESLPNGRDDFLDHVCEQPACCYPRHLERVTQKENNRRGRVRVEHDHPWLGF